MSRPIHQLRALMLLAAAIAGAVAAAQGALTGAAAWADAVRGSSIDTATAARIARLIDDAEAQTATRAVEGQPPLELVTITPASSTAAPSLIDAAGDAINRLTAWLGPLPAKRLTIVDAPAHAGLAGASYPGIAVTSSRLFTTRREFAAERALTAAIARQYALALAAAPDGESWFADGLADYFATRAIHETFEGRYYLTLRYFGGYVPHSLRAIVMSPNPLDPRPRVVALSEVGFEPADAAWRLARRGRDRAHRLTMALHTLERFVGWPALQAALTAFMPRAAATPPAIDDFVAVLSEQRGDDLSWFFAQAMRLDAHFDYAVVALTSTPAASGWATTVAVRRLGAATFDGSGVPRSASTARSLPVLTRFADGSEIAEWIDGRDREWTFQYSSASPATLASVDPEAILLLDADRTNNTRTLDRRRNGVGVRLTFNWLSWLQDAMLACTAVI